ncbi:MAG: hypothetical protein P1V18_04815 [Candidatus Gracilibacteria bacterium]|nr:hypothetical protein [Candidatus Gracilibacteria bacterium]
MGAPKRKMRAMDEVFRPTSDDKNKQHRAMIKKFLDRGYKVRSEETEEEIGVGNELIEVICVTILEPADHTSKLPLVKFEAKETFGRYDWEDEVFDEWDESNFKVDVFQKSSDIREHNAAWESINLFGE